MKEPKRKNRKSGAAGLLIDSGITLSPCQRRPLSAHVAELGRAPGSAHMVKRVSRMNGEEIAAAIEASHPMETEEAGVMDADALAMHLVGARHEKRELVNLVRWLLIGAPNDPAHRRRTEDSKQP